MAWRIIQQPNGRYARFSEVVYDFTDYGLTRREALELCKRYGRNPQAAEAEVRRAEKEQDRFTGAMDAVLRQHGMRIAKKRLQAMTQKTG